MTGSSSIVDENSHEPLLSILSLIVETAVKLRKDGHRVVIVSSGAIAMGMRRMDVEKRPKDLSSVQVSSERRYRWGCGLTWSIGFGSSRSMPAYRSVGQPVFTAEAASCANTTDQE